MNRSPYAPFYDLFKLIVAILLLLLFFFLTLWMPSRQPPQSLLPSVTPPPVRSTQTVGSTISSPTSTSTSVPLTATTTAQATPSPTETSEPTQPAPVPTETPTPEATTPPVVENPPVETVCVATTRTQLQVGMKAVIQRRLNFRSTAGIKNNRLSTNSPGTQVDVIGGPECTQYENGSSYLWWQIKLPNGEIGWSAEASAFGGFYFMEPVQ